MKMKLNPKQIAKYAVGGAIGAASFGVGLGATLIGPFAVGNLFKPVGDYYATNQNQITGAGIRAVFGVAAVGVSFLVGKKFLNANAAKGISALAASGAVAGVAWPYVGPKVRQLSAKAAGTEPAGIGSLLEGAPSDLEDELLALPGGAESLVYDGSEPAGIGSLMTDDEPGGLGDQYAFDTESNNMLIG